MKPTLTILTALLLVLTAGSQQTINIESGEKWYGAVATMGRDVPFADNTAKISLATDNYKGQTAPVMLSNYGRYIWSDEPFSFAFKEGKIVVDKTGITAVKAGKNLREAYLRARNDNFKGSATAPEKAFFESAQFVTKAGMSQSEIENHADALLSKGFKGGVLILNHDWQPYNGNFDFSANLFPDPKAMIERLHAKGFKVMLWVTPFVSPDSPTFRDLTARGYLIDGVIKWRNGYSACYDLTNQQAREHITSQLKTCINRYGFDGYSFEAADASLYAVKNNPTAQSMRWAEIGMSFPISEYSACWKMQCEPLAQRIENADNTWESLATVIPNILNAGLMGYAYTCPGTVSASSDQMLTVRTAQLQAMMPIMRFDALLWDGVGDENAKYIKEAATIHDKMSQYISQLATEAATIGEPIIRSLEYMFPNKGFSGCNDQFMLGAKYLVAPILTPDGKRLVRLPQGTWVDDKGEKFRGPLVINVSAEAGRLPYYEKK